MSRDLSSTALRSAYAQETGEVWLVLCTITHPSLSEPLRFVNDMQSLTSRGNVYIAFPFEIELPTEDEESAGEARLVLDNVDRAIVRAIREMVGPPEGTLEVVLASSPDTVEAEFPGMILRDTQYDALKVEGVLRFEDITAEPISLEMTPQRFPGLF